MDTFLPPECLPKNVWEYSAEDTWVDCARRRALLGAHITTAIVVVIILVIMMFSGFKWWMPVVVVGTVALAYGAAPWWAKRKARVSYQQFHRGYEAYKVNNPAATYNDYLNFGQREREVAATQQTASAQTQMAFAQSGIALGQLVSAFRP